MIQSLRFCAQQRSIRGLSSIMQRSQYSQCRYQLSIWFLMRVLVSKQTLRMCRQGNPKRRLYWHSHTHLSSQLTRQYSLLPIRTTSKGKAQYCWKQSQSCCQTYSLKQWVNFRRLQVGIYQRWHSSNSRTMQSNISFEDSCLMKASSGTSDSRKVSFSCPIFLKFSLILRLLSSACACAAFCTTARVKYSKAGALTLSGWWACRILPYTQAH